VSRPSEVERGFVYVVLSDLLEGVVEEVLPALSAPRRRALEAALLRTRERALMLLVLENPPERLAELGAVVLNDHQWRRRGGLE